MQKKEAWPELLNNFVKQNFQKPFGPWGSWDCCMMAADGVLAMTGEDFAADFRGKYDDAPSAYKALMEYADGGILATMEKLAPRFGWVPHTSEHFGGLLKIRRGDIVMLPPELCGGDTRFDGALGLCCGTVSVYLGEKSMRGVSTIPSPGTQGIIAAWRIKHGRD